MTSRKEIRGWWQATWLRRQPLIRTHLERIIETTTIELAAGAPIARQCVIMVGLSKSGKTWMIDHHPQLRHYARPESQLLHDRLNQSLASLRDDTTITGPAYWERQCLSRWMRLELLRRLLGRGVSIVADSCHLAVRTRRQELRLARQAGYRTTIIWVNCDAVEHYRRLLREDDRREFVCHQPRTWWALVAEIQRSRFQPPEEHEADVIRYFHSGSPIATITLEP